jgi:Zn-dependent M28 family amino/carboxypeptidase
MFRSLFTANCRTIDFGCAENREMAITASNLEMHVRKLATEIGERNVFRFPALAEAANYIQHEWSEQGYEVLVQSYVAKGIPCQNLEITRWGQSRRQQIILVGAHYDSVEGSPGADDNASGVAALLEISRRLTSVTTERTVRLVAFVNEEPPFFYWKDMGSMIYARAARRRGDDIRLMISLEMLGYYDQRPKSQHYPPFFRFFYPDRANFIAFVSNLPSRRQLRRTASFFRSHSDFPLEHLAALGIIPGISWSDHLSFWRQGYRALMVTDTSFYRYPYYHTPWDVPDRLDYESLARVTEGLCAAIVALANDSANP